MEVALKQENGTLVAQVEGRIDGNTAREFEDAVQAAVGNDVRSLVIDLESLDYISSAGLRALLLIAKEMWKKEAKFALCSLSKPVSEVVELSGFDKIIPVHPSQAEALASFAE